MISQSDAPAPEEIVVRKNERNIASDIFFVFINGRVRFNKRIKSKFNA